jgi:hypothetical protein
MDQCAWMDTKADKGKEGCAATERVVKDNHGNNDERISTMITIPQKEVHESFKLDCSKLCRELDTTELAVDSSSYH